MKKLSLLSTLLLFLAGLLPNLQTTANNTINKHPHLLANNKNVSYSINTDCDNQIPDIEWQNTIGGNGDESLSVIRPTADGGYILGGSSNSNISGDKTNNSKGGYDYWIVKLNAAGDIVLQKTIGGNDADYLTDIQQTTDGGYILGGYSNSGISGNKTEASQGGTDYWVVKLPNFTDAQALFSIPYVYKNTPATIINTSSNATSYQWQLPDLTENEKTTRIPYPQVPLADLKALNTLVVQPNPAQQSAQITLPPFAVEQNAQLQVFDVTGKLVQSISLNNNSTLTTLDVKDLANGLYIVSLSADGVRLAQAKMVVQH